MPEFGEPEFGEEELAEEEEETEETAEAEPEEEGGEAGASAGEEAGAEETEGPEEFGGEDFEMPDIDSELTELGEEFGAPEGEGPGGLEPGPAEAEEGEEAEEGGEVEEAEGFEEDFDLPEFGEPEFGEPEFGEEEPAEEEAETAETAEADASAGAEAGDMDISEGFPFDEEAEEEEAEPEPEMEEFDMSELEEETVEEPDQFSIPDMDFEAPAGPDEEEEVPGTEDIDEFDLGDIGFELEEGGEGEEVSEEDLNPATDVSAGPAIPMGAEDFELSDEDFEAVVRTLGELPRNLKIAVEELIGERGLAGENLKKLLNMLIAGEKAKAIAAFVGKQLGRKIEVPKQYEKKTGAEFEEEKQSFSYVFRYTILPVLKVVTAGAAALALIGFLGYRFVYRPIHARMLYAQGYEEVQEDNYISGNRYFDRATDKWVVKNWFYTYAEAFEDKNQYYLAEEKYDQLLSRFPLDKKGILEYASLESEVLSDYPKAEQLLRRYLDEELYDYDAMLLLGDNYMRWADEVPSRYENARETYAVLLEKYGGRSEVLFRMLRYFIRTDNLKEVEHLKNQFQENKRLTVDPHIYAELGGYLLDNNKIEEVDEILFRAMDVDKTVPEIHYQLSRYFHKINEHHEEKTALIKTLDYLRTAKPYSKREFAMLIDSHNKLGKLHYRDDMFLDAEQEFQKAKQLYEDARERKIIGVDKQFGEIYANLGDLYYYISNNYDTAAVLYTEAEQNLYSNPGISYKKGFIRYIQNDYEEALLDFYESAEPYSENKNLMYATANTLYQRGAYFAAQGYYNHLLDVLEKEVENIPFLMPEEQKEHRSLLEYQTKVYNNVGVTLIMLNRRSGDGQKFSEGLRYLARSTEYADILSRDPELMERTPSVQLAYLNTRSVLYPDAVNELQIYDEIPKDMDELFF